MYAFLETITARHVSNQTIWLLTQSYRDRKEVERLEDVWFKQKARVVVYFLGDINGH